jgi:hypothetical protein
MTGHVDSLQPPKIRDLAIIGDRRTAAIVSRQGDVLWYCPGRFDAPGVLSGLLGSDGGSVRLVAPGAVSLGRAYIAESGVLRTSLSFGGEAVTVTDWLNFGDAPAGVLCRMVSPAPEALGLRMSPRPDFGRGAAVPERLAERSVAIANGGTVHASHPLAIEGEDIVCSVPAGEEAWLVLADDALDSPPDLATLRHWRDLSRAAWDRIGEPPKPEAYGREVAESLRALRMLTYEPTGGMVAAATTSLPEIPGGTRNYDYRYVWLRDAGMIASALVRAGDGGLGAEGFLGFVCSTYRPERNPPLPALADLDGNPAPDTETLPLAGYLDSRPVRIGNAARDQLQLDGLGNVLLAAKLIYGALDCERPHWETVRDVADYLAQNWREPDHGIWEEETRLHYTSSKVIVACGLDSIAEFADDPEQAGRWRQAVGDIRRFVAEECMTSEGAYASYAGGEDVDVSAALFPVWAYADADAPEMVATMTALERDHSPDGLLFRRSLVCADAAEEGAFLAGTFWVAHYWIIRGDLARARRIIDRALGYANDLGLFAEEADPEGDAMLGNFPQTFVHAAFIGAVVDLRAAIADDPSVSEREISHAS